MSGCKFPEHHRGAGSERRGSPVTVVVTVVVIAGSAARYRVVIGEVFRWVLVGLAVSAAVAAAAVVVLIAKRIGRGPGLRVRLPGLRNVPRALWAAARWHHLTRNLGLAYPDRHRKGKVRRPRTVILPSAHGITARVRTVPGVGRAEVEKVADDIANAWRVPRVSIAQPRSGHLVVRGLRRDPLLEHLSLRDTPAGAYAGRDLTRLYVGRDESGQHRWMQVRDNTAVTVAGQPGAGKSVAVNGLLLQWAPSPAVQFGTADGKSPVDGGDYEVWRPRAWRTCSDSREDTADMLSDACKIMRERLGRVADLTGSRNGWHQGPTPDFPLLGLVLDECQRYLDVTVARRDKNLEKLILSIQQMTGDIVRQGRSVLMFLVLATQRATVDSIPGQIRDNAALSLALAQKTVDASVAALGSQVRDYPTFLPTTLQGPEYTGCAIATMRTGRDPFTRLRFPAVTHDDLAAAAAATARLRRDPADLLPPITVPDDVSELTVAE